MNVHWLAGALALTLCSTVVDAAGSPPASVLPIRLDLTADEPLAGELRGCLLEELRRTPELRLSDESGAVTLAVIAAEQRMSDGELIGYLVYSGGYLAGPTCSKAPEAGQPRGVIIQWQSLRMLPPDLNAACKTVFGALKSSVVEPTLAELARIREQYGQKPKRDRP